MEIILAILGIALGLVLIRLLFHFILGLIQYGLVFGLLAGMCTGLLYLIGWMGGDTAWTITKWAFYIGCGVSIICAIGNPIEFLQDVFSNFEDDINSSSRSSSGSRNYRSGSSSNYGGGICGNCSRYDSSTHYCSYAHRSVSESSSGCSDMTYG